VVVETMLDSTTPLSYSTTVGVPGAVGVARVALAPGHPSRGGVVLTVELPRAEAITLEVYDAGGRRVARRLDPSRLAGVHRVAWSPAGGAAAGVYFVRVRGEGWARDVKAVVLP
jgi:hypothetical protein